MEEKTKDNAVFALGLSLVLSISLFLVLSTFAGCSARPQVYDHQNLGFQIVMADSKAVAEACSAQSSAEYNDDGVFRTNRENTWGCWIPDKREIWVDWYAPDTTSVLLHELCHADGRPKSICADVR